jgi:hypothetical protein
MTRAVSRRAVLSIAAGAFLGSLAGPSTRLVGGRSTAEQVARRRRRTLYVGAYHWGFVILDADGVERQRVRLRKGTTVRLVAFSAGSADAVAALPQAIRRRLPSHEVLEMRNEGRIPVQQGMSLESLLEAAERDYPDHGLEVVPDASLTGMGPVRRPGWMAPGWRHDWPGMWGGDGGPDGLAPHGPRWPGHRGGMLVAPVYLGHHAAAPTVVTFRVDVPGSYALSCPVYCGYGHAYMVMPGALVVRE